MHAADKVFVKTYLKAIRDTFFLICGIFQYVIFLSNRRGKFELLGLQGKPPTLFPRLVGHPDLSMKKVRKVVDLFTVLIFFQSKKFTICKVKDEKEKQFSKSNFQTTFSNKSGLLN